MHYLAVIYLFYPDKVRFIFMNMKFIRYLSVFYYFQCSYSDVGPRLLQIVNDLAKLRFELLHIVTVYNCPGESPSVGRSRTKRNPSVQFTPELLQFEFLSMISSLPFFA